MQNLWQKIVARWRYFRSTFFYLGYIQKAIQYSFTRDGLERRFAPKPAEGGFAQPGRLLAARQTENGAGFKFEHTELTLTCLGPDLVRLEWQSSALPPPYAVLERDWPAVDFVLEQVNGGWQLKTACLAVQVSREGRVLLFDHQGQLLREELPPDHRKGGWVHRVPLAADERIYGLGERAASLNLRQARDEAGGVPTFQMWNFDMAGRYGPGADPLYINIPLYLSLKRAGSYLIFYENSYNASFRFREEATVAFTGGPLRYYLVVGSPTTLVERYCELTGKPPLPPRWALGYHQSRWGYETEAAVRNVAQAFQVHDIPLSAIHLDIDAMEDFKAFTIDRERFPLLAEFTKDLKLRGVRLVNIVNPGIKFDPQLPVFREGIERGAFLADPDGQIVYAPVWPGWCAFPDFSNPEVREWAGGFYANLLKLGVSGFWHDMNEPAAFVAWGDRSLPRIVRHDLDGRGGDHYEVHNLYGFLQAMAGYEGLRKCCPESRPFIVSRAGWAGLQRYAWSWTGDTEATWEVLRMTVPQVINLGLSGIGFTGPDIGGFRGNPSAELYIRFMQLGCFLPFCRTHSSNDSRSRAPWSYDESTLSIVREAIKLRYRLLPYFYTLAWQASQNGLPLVRPLFFADPANESLWDIDDCFLLGTDLAIYPVGKDNQRRREGMLPPGRWYQFWDDKIFEGPGLAQFDAPLERLPVLVRAGAVLPMAEHRRLALHIYVPVDEAEHHSQLYEDAGDGEEPGRLERYRLQRRGKTLHLERTAAGDYPFEGIIVHVHGLPVRRALIDGREVEWNGDGLEAGDFRTLQLSE